MRKIKKRRSKKFFKVTNLKKDQRKEKKALKGKKKNKNPTTELHLGQ
jgi:hypothetical protein